MRRINFTRPFSFTAKTVMLLLVCVVNVTAQITRDDARLAMQCYNNAFYYQYGTYGNSYKALYYMNTFKDGRTHFWWEMESIETLIDAYNISNDPQFKDRIRYLYHGVRDYRGLTWEYNEFNDDIIWGALMAIRAFQIFNDGAMKDMAINNFNIVWNRAWDNNLGGGLWWKTDKKSKNACVNAPAAICAMLIYYATGDVTYRNRAKMIMDWMKDRLYVAGTGEVKGAMDANGVITEGARTYTQGTFIGAAGELHRYYPADDWLVMGLRAMEYTKNVMSNGSGLLPDEYCGTEDCPGFKSIFARWACKFVKDYSLQSSFGPWLNYNAHQAWNYRNSSGLMWAQWWRRTHDGFLTSWETTSGVAMMNNVFLFNSGSTARHHVDGELPPALNRENQSVYIYPTVVEKVLKIKGSEEFKSVRVINSNGSKLRVNERNNEIDVEIFPAGIYLLQIETLKGEYVYKRFIKN